MSVDLIDPASGQKIQIKIAQMQQRCTKCKDQLRGRHIVSVGGDKLGWTCLWHLEQRLMSVPMTAEARAQLEAKRDLAGAEPGESIVVSRTLLRALGAL